MKTPKALLVGTLLIGLVVCPSCSRKSASHEIVVAGSTSIQPFADRWAEIYMHEHAGHAANVQGGGSSAGIQAALSGAADIGMSSRELKPEEKVLTEFIVAWDGLAVIVHPSNPVSNLTVDEVKRVFSGEIGAWKLLGGKDAAITVVTREEGSGTRGAFQELVMGKTTRIDRGAIVQDSNGTVREIVSGDPNAVGYISLGLVNDRVKALRLEGIEARDANILNRTYTLFRPFLFVTNGAPRGEARAFIDFVLSDEGQALIKKEGLIPVRETGREALR